jgi:uroporphyrinogen decarboxylase
MNSRERVLAAAERRKTDKVPTSLRCTPEVLQALISRLGVTTKQEVYDALDIDLRWIYLPFIGPAERSAAVMGSEGVDFWGCRNTKMGNKFNTYYEITGHPLAEAETVEDVENYDWPSLDWWDYDAIPKIIEAELQKDRRAIMFFAGGAFETPWYIRGFEQFLMDLYLNPDIVTAICSKVEEYYRLRALRVLEAAGGMIDIVGSGGDLGGETALLLDPNKWRELIKPYTASLIQTFKQLGLKTFYHSDGAITSVIEDFIEIGLDILDPIQVGAAGMTPEELSPKFGSRLTFHGAIDEVHLLPHASPEEVYRETGRVISILGQNHGYIVSPTHQLQGDTTVDNVLAIYRAVNDFRW